ncbi:MAG: ankyrin repeat domain-containing protein [Bacteroidota bacterium]
MQIPEEAYWEALEAIDRGDIEQLAYLLDEYPDLVHVRSNNTKPPYDGYFKGATLLHHVAGNPQRTALPDNIIEITKLLLNRGAKVDAVTEFRSDWSWTTLGLVTSGGLAVDQGHAEALTKLLLDAGADPNFNNGLNLYGALFHTVSTKRLFKLAELLADLGATLDMCMAAALGRLDKVISFYAEHDVLKPAAYAAYRPEQDSMAEPTKDQIEEEALVWACMCGRLDIVRFFINKGVNLHAYVKIHNEKCTPLHAAVWGNSLDLIKYLIEIGADVNCRDKTHNSSALGWAIFLDKGEIKDYLLSLPLFYFDILNAAEFGLKEHVEDILSKESSKCNGDDGKGLPLRLASYEGYYDIVKLLLEHGADTELKSSNGKTALDWAADQKHFDVVELIRSFKFK